jgi:LCP family protein required for cell wall assembly
MTGIRQRSLGMLALIATIVAIFPLLSTVDRSSAAPVLMGRVHDDFDPSKGKIFVLVIGTDARSGNPNSRADAIHIAGINTKTLKGGILNFPRDSWVNIPGYGTSKINEAVTAGGPELLAKTLEGVTGIRLDYWVMTGFNGFQGAVADLGGVKMHIPSAVYDRGYSGANLKAGTYKLKGFEALAYARTRHAFSEGDLARTRNQSRILLALLAKLRNEVSQSPAALLRWMAVTKEHTRYSISPDEMFRLGVLASQVKPKDVANVTVPVSIGSVGAASVVFIQEGARFLYQRFRQTGSL